MYQYISLILIAWLASASKVRDEEINHSPLILSPSPNEFLYEFPIRARITTDQKQEFYFDRKKDGLFFCPNENEDAAESEYFEEDDSTMVDHSDEFTYLNYCLFEKKFNENEKKLCASEVKPIIIEDKYEFGNRDRVRCGETGYLYKVAYKVCVENSEQNMFHKLYNKLKFGEISQEYDTTAYEVCYDHLQNRVLFTEHSILSPYILRNLNLEGERALHKFTQKYSTETYGIKNLKNLENTIEAYKNQANSEDKQLLQKFVPTNDFALGHLMKTTFHMINYGLIHKSKAPVWNAINLYVRSRIIKQIHEKYFDNPQIFTGTFYDEKSVDEIKDNLPLGNDHSSGIIRPKLWWKVLYSVLRNEAVVIIMHNDNDPKEICEKEETACEPTKWKTAQLNEKDFQFVYCCSFLSASESIPVLKDLVPKPINPINTRAEVMQLG